MMMRGGDFLMRKVLRIMEQIIYILFLRREIVYSKLKKKVRP